MTGTATSEPEVSVIVCTRHRNAQLRTMLTSAAGLVVPAGLNWELLVIDNADDRETATVVDDFSDRLPIRRIVEASPGLSHARNRGVSEARGRHICWTDDDVILDAAWLSAYVEAFRRFPAAVVFGGKILPRPQPPSPRWFQRCADHWRLRGAMAHRDMGDAVTPVTHEGGRTPYGANFAVRADAQRRLPYNVDLGLRPCGGRLGEESDVIYRLLKEGGHGWWIPGARVDHIIPAERQTWDSVLAYYRRAGETAAYLRDAYPRDNAGEVARSPLFAFLNDRTVRALAAANRVGFELALRLGLFRLALGFLAKRGFYEGVMIYRSVSGAQAETAFSSPIEQGAIGS
jgi:glycosyltransferase involved in cell wall biosynthesis